MENSGYEKFVFEKRGKLDPPEISRALQSSDFGLAVTPLHLLGKSGAVAAMREHGLPVVVNRYGSETSPALVGRVRAPQTRMQTHLDAFPPLILLNENFEKNLIAAKRTACRETLNEVADQFLKDLERIS